MVFFLSSVTGDRYSPLVGGKFEFFQFDPSVASLSDLNADEYSHSFSTCGRFTTSDNLALLPHVAEDAIATSLNLQFFISTTKVKQNV